MTKLYYVTAQKPTAVMSCVSGNFSSIEQLNLIIAKNNILDFFLVCPEGLTLLRDINIHGKIDIMKSFRPQSSFRDLLFVVTEKCDAFILDFKLEGNRLKVHTKAHGNIADRCGEPPENGRTAVIDPLGRVIALRITEGLLKIIPLEAESELKAVNIRLEEQVVHDFEFLHGYSNPTMIFLHSDNFATHIKTSELSLKDKEFVNTLWKQDHVETEASMIISVVEPLGGAIVIGKETILYHNGLHFFASAPPLLSKSLERRIVCYAKVDTTGQRYVLGDMLGNLFMLLLEVEETMEGKTNVKDMKLELLGEITMPECICYLDNGVLFVGSRIGNSQLVRLNKYPDPETGSYVTILDSFVNLAPVVDMVVVNGDGSRQDQIVTCSGFGKEGSLQIVSNGITAHELATIELEGIKGIWPLSVKSDSNTHNTLVLSFVKHTKMLLLNGEDVEETEIFGFLPNEQTLYSSNLNNNCLLLITQRRIRLVSVYPAEKILDEWQSNDGRNVDIVASNNFQIVCSQGKELLYFEIFEDHILKKNKTVLKYEIACLAISPGINSNFGKFIVAGLWDEMSLSILRISDLTEVHWEYVKGLFIPRSVLISKLEEKYYLFCGLGNGCLIYFNFDMDEGVLSEKCRITLGTQPVLLKTLDTGKCSSVFACSDLPTVIYSCNEKLIFPHVNVPRINSMCTMNSAAFPDCVALVTDSLIVIANMNEYQKLHIRSIPLGEAPKRIAFQPETQTFGVLTFRMDSTSSPDLLKTTKKDSASLLATTKSQSTSTRRDLTIDTPQYNETTIEIHNFLLVEGASYEILHAHQMLPSEYCLSLISVHLGKDKTPYYAIGTAYIDPEESEPKRGRIVILQVREGKLQEIAEELVKGPCYALAELNGKIVAGIGSNVRLFEWTDDNNLRLECSHFNNIQALYLKVKGDFVLIGDIMRSLTLIRYKSIEGTFDEICRDFNPAWMTALEILDDDTFLGAENSLNLYTCRKNSTSICDDEREQIESEGEFHVGDLINVIRRGSLAVPFAERTNGAGSFILGTVSGRLGVLLQIPDQTFELLRELQKRLSSHLSNPGNIEHEHWRRSTRSATSTSPDDSPCSNIIDGDLIEMVFHLPQKEINQIVSGMKTPTTNQDVLVSELMETIENLSRLH